MEKRDSEVSMLVLAGFVFLFFAFAFFIKPDVSGTVGLASFESENVVGGVGVGGVVEDNLIIFVGVGIIAVVLMIIISIIWKRKKKNKMEGGNKSENVVKAGSFEEETAKELGLSVEEINKLFEGGSYVPQGNVQESAEEKVLPEPPSPKIEEKRVERAEKGIIVDVSVIKNQIRKMLKSGCSFERAVSSLIKKGVDAGQINKAIDEINKENIVNYMVVCRRMRLNPEHSRKLLLSRGWNVEQIKKAESILHKIH
jgi:hypothetical protein